MSKIKSDDANQRSRFFFDKLLAPIVVALAVGGTAPWWIDIIRGNTIDENSTGADENSVTAPDKPLIQQSHDSSSNTATGRDIYYNEVPSSVQATQESVALELKMGMPYEEGRQIIIDRGWQPIFPSSLGTFPNLDDPAIKYIFEERGYREVEDCSGTGMGFCIFRFHNGMGKFFLVTTVNNGPGDEVTVWQWSFE